MPSEERVSPPGPDWIEQAERGRQWALNNLRNLPGSPVRSELLAPLEEPILPAQSEMAGAVSSSSAQQSPLFRPLLGELEEELPETVLTVAETDIIAPPAMNTAEDPGRGPSVARPQDPCVRCLKWLAQKPEHKCTWRSEFAVNCDRCSTQGNPCVRVMDALLPRTRELRELSARANSGDQELWHLIRTKAKAFTVAYNDWERQQRTPQHPVPTFEASAPCRHFEEGVPRHDRDCHCNQELLRALQRQTRTSHEILISIREVVQLMESVVDQIGRRSC